MVARVVSVTWAIFCASASDRLWKMRKLAVSAREQLAPGTRECWTETEVVEATGGASMPFTSRDGVPGREPLPLRVSRAERRVLPKEDSLGVISMAPRTCFSSAVYSEPAGGCSLQLRRSETA